MAATICAASPASARVKPGDAAPAYSVTLLDGSRIGSDAVRGQVVIVNRWATWCVPCRAELPLLDAYYRAHAAQGLRIFAVATQDSVSIAALKPLSAALSFPLARGISSARFAILEGVPTNYVIDRHGIVRYAEVGAFDEATLEQVVGPLLAEPASPLVEPAAAPSPSGAIAAR
jgi:thiol-disulfide isomerase/thioredoxin